MIYYMLYKILIIILIIIIIYLLYKYFKLYNYQIISKPINKNSISSIKDSYTDTNTDTNTNTNTTNKYEDNNLNDNIKTEDIKLGILNLNFKNTDNNTATDVKITLSDIIDNCLNKQNDDICKVKENEINQKTNNLLDSEYTDYNLMDKLTDIINNKDNEDIINNKDNEKINISDDILNNKIDDEQEINYTEEQISSSSYSFNKLNNQTVNEIKNIARNKNINIYNKGKLKSKKEIINDIIKISNI